MYFSKLAASKFLEFRQLLKIQTSIQAISVPTQIPRASLVLEILYVEPRKVVFKTRTPPSPPALACTSRPQQPDGGARGVDLLHEVLGGGRHRHGHLPGWHPRSPCQYFHWFLSPVWED